MKKKSYNGHNFCIRRRKNANNTLKKLEKISDSIPPGFTRSAIHRILKFQNKKKLWPTEEFSQQNKKNQKKGKNSVAHQCQGCATELLGGIRNFESRPIILRVGSNPKFSLVFFKVLFAFFRRRMQKLCPF